MPARTLRTSKPCILVLDLKDPYEYIVQSIVRSFDGNVKMVTFEFNVQAWLYPEHLTLTLIKTRMMEEKPDLILLGHNRGGGHVIAKVICEEDRSKVIVMSNSPLTEPEKEGYRKLGIDLFSLRHQTPGIVMKKYEPQPLLQLV